MECSLPGFNAEFFLPFGFCLPKFGPVLCVSFVQGEICAEFFVCLFVFPLMGKVEWGGDPVYWSLGLYFCFVCCLDEASCTGCYWWLGDARSCIQVVSFVWKVKVKESEVAQSCPTLCDPVECSPPGSSVHGTLQARILEWVAISFSRGSSQPRDWTQVSRIAGRRFNLWATGEVQLRILSVLKGVF